MIEIISTDTAPQPLGHYAQAVRDGETIYVSGQLPIKLNSPATDPGDIKKQTQLTLENLEAVLLAAGSDRNHVLKTTIFISDISLWADANAVYADFFGDHKPARSAVPTKDLPRGFQIEIEAVAKVKKD